MTEAAPILVNMTEPWFSHVCNGDKLVEGRLNRGKWACVKTGDIWLVTEPVSGRHIYLKVIHVVKAADMGQLYSIYKRWLLPGVASSEEAIAVYETFDGYELSEQRRLGVLGFIISPVLQLP